MGLNTISKRGTDIATALKRTFGDESGVQVIDDDVIRWINEAQLDICMKNRILKVRAGNDLVAGQGYYPLPDGIIAIESIHVNGIPVQPRTITQMEALILAGDPGRIETKKQPEYWWEYAGGVEFWPKPSESVSQGLTIYFVAAPTLMTSLTSFLSIPDRYYKAVQESVLASAYEMDENFDAYAMKQQQLNNTLSQFINEEETSAHRTYSTIQYIED